MYMVLYRIGHEYKMLNEMFNTVLLKLRDIHITKHKNRIDMIIYNNVYNEDLYNNTMVSKINEIYKYTNNILDNASKYLETQKSTPLIIVKGKDYNQTMKKISSVKKDKNELSFLTKYFSINKIKIWKEKIEELLSKFTEATFKCDNFNQCKDIIDNIYSILYIFITNPNSMNDIISIPDSSSKTTYNIRRYNIYCKYLKDKYNNNLTDDDLIKEEYRILLNEFKFILEQTKQVKLEYCKEKFNI